MNQHTHDSSELFLQFSRRRMFILLAVVLLLGVAALSLMVSPNRAVWRTASQASLVAVAVAMTLVVSMSIWRRRWSDDAPEVRVAMQDEWRRTNMDRASRAALIVSLAVQYPLVMIFGFAMRLPAPRGAFAMAASTITLGLATLITLFLFYDRD